MSNPNLLLTDDPLWIVTPVAWRDVCFSLPATRAIAEIHPVRILCPEAQTDFWRAAGMAEIHVADSSNKPAALVASLPSIEQCLLWEDSNAAKATALAKVQRRIGLPANNLAKRLTHPLSITHRPGPTAHRVQRYLDVATALGTGAFEGKHFASLESTVPRQPGSVLIAPDSDFGSHYEWPASRWIELISSLPIRPSLVRIHGSGPIARELAAATQLEMVAIPRPAEFGAFERCIAADSSTAHLAAANGVTCAVLYGPGDPESTRPLGKQHLSIRRKAECSPCGLDKCAIDLRCQFELEARHAHRALTEQWEWQHRD